MLYNVAIKSFLLFEGDIMNMDRNLTIITINTFTVMNGKHKKMTLDAFSISPITKNIIHLNEPVVLQYI